MQRFAASRRRAVIAGGLVLAAMAHSVVAQPGGTPLIAAASDLKFVLAEIAERFTRESGQTVRIVYGSSGNFAAQIENGAPFQLFLSADESLVQRLVDKQLMRDGGALYAIGRVVLFAPHGSALKVDAALAGLKTALSDGRIKRFAIANPEHAPYGRAAREALQHAGLWEAVQPRLVLGENATQATQFVATGNAEGGIVPLSLTTAPEIARTGNAALLPQHWHAPLRQRMALTRQADRTAESFYAFLQGPAAREAFVRFGFALPGER